MRRLLGKLLLSTTALITAIAPTLNDWNDTHIFNPRWAPHARFEDPDQPLPRGALGLLPNLAGAGATVLTAVGGWLLARR